MRGLLCLVGIAGCYQRVPESQVCTTGCDAGPTDAVDATRGSDAPCPGHLGIQVCETFAGTPTLPSMLDTDGSCDALIIQSGTEICVIAGHQIAFNTKITVTGSRALLLYADMISISGAGAIDAASHGTSTGPAFNFSGCAGPGAVSVMGTGGPGGPGGSFGGTGGYGGAGGGTGTSTIITGSGTSAVSFVRGGCPGLPGTIASQSMAGAGGNGGGAVYLLASTSITILGWINASGQGGRGSTSDGGAGGGGSGGLIVLDAPTIMVSGTLLASGGGGGADLPGTAIFHNGSDPLITNPYGAATGGVGPTATNGGGGSGSSLAVDGGPGQSGANGGVNTGGGGGGGGAGHIVLYGVHDLTNSKIVPAYEAGS